MTCVVISYNAIVLETLVLDIIKFRLDNRLSLVLSCCMAFAVLTGVKNQVLFVNILTKSHPCECSICASGMATFFIFVIFPSP
jgi:hypothetical protein